MSDPDISSDLKKLEVMVNDLEKDVTQWLTQKECQPVSVENYFSQLEAITKISSKVGHFTRLSYSADMTVRNFTEYTGSLNKQKVAVARLNPSSPKL